ncbi:DUF427 domain-containing protein [soil metagenome]
MSLTVGTAPFGPRNSGDFNFDAEVLGERTLYLQESPKRVRAIFNGETAVESQRAKLLHETGHLPIYYFPIEDVRVDLLVESDHTTHCPVKGDTSYQSIKVGDEIAENAVWSYPEPLESSPIPADHVAVHWHSMDHWFEEEEEVFVHARDPYTRIDVLDSSRHVRVLVAGEVVAETDRPRLLLETGLPVRYYIPPEDVRTELLIQSDTWTQCPYKGTASYWSAEFDGERIEDVAWSYAEPLQDAQRVANHLCFLGEMVELEVGD